MIHRIQLQTDDVAQDHLDAIRDQERAEAGIKVGWRPAPYDPGSERMLEYRTHAYEAERAFARFRGLKGWSRDPNGFGKPDVDGYSVRHGSKPHYGLQMRADDNHYPYALVCSSGNPLEFLIVGWIGYDEAWLLAPGGLWLSDHTVVIRQIHLHPFEEQCTPDDASGPNG